MTRIGIVGTGKRAENFIKIYSKFPDVEISGVLGRSQQRVIELSKKYNIDSFTDFDRFLSNNPNGICVATLPELHPKYSIKALESGINVLCEKPMALNLNDAKKMLEAAKTSKKVLMIGFTLRFLDIFQKIKKIIDSGELGKIKSVWFKDGTFYPDRKWMLEDKISGGITLEYSINKIDLISWFINSQASAVYAQSITDIYSPNGNHTDFGIIKFQNGSLGSFSSSFSLNIPNYSDFGIIGTQKSLVIKNNRIFIGGHHTKPNKLRSISTQIPKIKSSKNDSLEKQLASFVKSCNKEPVEIPTGCDGYAALEISLACINSAKQNKVIYL